MKSVKWDKRPYDNLGHQQKLCATVDQREHSFDEPLQRGHLVTLQSTVQGSSYHVRVRIQDPTDLSNVHGTVDLTADPNALKALNLAMYDEVVFSRDQIFLRNFGD